MKGDLASSVLREVQFPPKMMPSPNQQHFRAVYVPPNTGVSCWHWPPLRATTELLDCGPFDGTPSTEILDCAGGHRGDAAPYWKCDAIPAGRSAQLYDSGRIGYPKLPKPLSERT